MTTAWAHLPNARHIDAVLAHIEAHPERWDAAWDTSMGDAWDAARNADRHASWDDARYVAWDAARYAAWSTARNADRHAAWDAARYAAWDAATYATWADARDACYALVAWDDAGQLMDMPVDAVRTLSAAGHHQAVLVLPARLAMEKS